MAKVNAAELRRMVEYIAERLAEAGEDGAHGLSESSCAEISSNLLRKLNQR